MATNVEHRAVHKGKPTLDGLDGPGEADEPATPTDATLAFVTHTDYLTRDNVRQMLPRLLQQVVSPPEDTTAAAQEMLVAAHFAADAHMSHPLGYAIGARQIASLLRVLYMARSVLFPTVRVITLRSVWDEQHESAALEVKAVMRLRGLGLGVPVLAEVFVELVDRRDAHPGALWISYWSEHYSLRSLAVALPGALARWVDWGARRGVALAAERLAGLLRGWR